MVEAKTKKMIEDLMLDIPVIDNDHGILFDLFNQLEDAAHSSEGLTTIGSYLNMIIEYSSYHFAREEALMDVCGIDNKTAHGEEHRRIIEGLLQLRRRYFSDNTLPLQPEEMDLCREWLVEHIITWDQTYIDTMRQMPDRVSQASAEFAEKNSGKKNDSGFI